MCKSMDKTQGYKSIFRQKRNVTKKKGVDLLLTLGRREQARAVGGLGPEECPHHTHQVNRQIDS